MGLESYNIMILPKNVSIIRDNEYWRLCGTSEVRLNVIEDNMMKICRRTGKNAEYVLNKCLDIKLYEDKLFFQGFEIRGCLSYLKGGIEECYNFYEFWKDKIPLNIFVLNQLVKVESVNDLYEVICYMYSEKIKIFKNQYGDIELKVTSGNFYHKIKKRNKWYYKIFSLTRNSK